MADQGGAPGDSESSSEEEVLVRGNTITQADVNEVAPAAAAAATEHVSTEGALNAGTPHKSTLTTIQTVQLNVAVEVEDVVTTRLRNVAANLRDGQQTVESLTRALLALLDQVEKMNRNKYNGPKLVARRRCSHYVVASHLKGPRKKDGSGSRHKFSPDSAYVKWDVELSPTLSSFVSVGSDMIYVTFERAGWFDVRCKLATVVEEAKKQKLTRQSVRMYLDAELVEVSLSHGQGSHNFNTIMKVTKGSKLFFWSSVNHAGGQSATLLNDLAILFVRD